MRPPEPWADQTDFKQRPSCDSLIHKFSLNFTTISTVIRVLCDRGSYLRADQTDFKQRPSCDSANSAAPRISTSFACGCEEKSWLVSHGNHSYHKHVPHRPELKNVPSLGGSETPDEQVLLTLRGQTLICAADTSGPLQQGVSFGLAHRPDCCTLPQTNSPRQAKSLQPLTSLCVHAASVLAVQ